MKLYVARDKDDHHIAKIFINEANCDFFIINNNKKNSFWNYYKDIVETEDNEMTDIKSNGKTVVEFNYTIYCNCDTEKHRYKCEINKYTSLDKYDEDYCFMQEASDYGEDDEDFNEQGDYEPVSYYVNIHVLFDTPITEERINYVRDKFGQYLVVCENNCNLGYELYEDDLLKKFKKILEEK